MVFKTLVKRSTINHVTFIYLHFYVKYYFFFKCIYEWKLRKLKLCIIGISSFTYTVRLQMIYNKLVNYLLTSLKSSIEFVLVSGNLDYLYRDDCIDILCHYLNILDCLYLCSKFQNKYYFVIFLNILFCMIFKQIIRAICLKSLTIFETVTLQERSQKYDPVVGEGGGKSEILYFLFTINIWYLLK